MRCGRAANESAPGNLGQSRYSATAHWSERHCQALALPDNADALARMRHRQGRARYALRKCTPEPVFGIIESVMQFRQFSLRGLRKVQTNGSWWR